MPKGTTQYTSGHDDDARATPYSKREAQRIQSQLRRPLGPEHVSTRSGAGNSSLSYIEGWRVISIANQIFGFDGWSSSIQNFTVDYETLCDTRWSVGGSCLVRITLRDGTYREDIGYGMIENAKSLGMAYEKIKKEAVTDAIKRAMRQFGNALGNCVYDKEYIRTVKHVQKQSRNRLQGEDLFRYSDMVDVASCANLQFGRGGDTDCASTGAAGDQPNTVAQDLKGVTDDRGEESDDFDMIDFGDDAFEEFNGMESDRPVIPESPSGSFNNRQAQHGNQPAQNTPTRVATGGPVWRPSSEPGPMPSRMQGASPGGQVSMASARNLSFQSHPPRPAIPAQQGSSTTTSVRRPSFAEASGFTPSPQMAAVLGTCPQSADNSTSVPSHSATNN